MKRCEDEMSGHREKRAFGLGQEQLVITFEPSTSVGKPRDGTLLHIDHGDYGTLPLAKGSEGTLGRTRGDLLYICMEKPLSVDALYTNNFWSTLHRHKPRP